MSRLVLFFCLIALALPAQAQLKVTSDLSNDLAVEAGQVYTGTIQVRNTSKTVQTAVVMHKDYLFFADGSNRYDEPGTLARSNAPWITFSPARLAIPPGQTMPVQYEVRVPDDEALCGSYWSMLLVEAQAAPRSKGEGLGMRAKMRFGVQVATHLGGDAEGACSTEIAMNAVQLARNAEGQPTLVVTLENTGAQFVRPRFWVELHSDAAEPVRLEGKAYRLYPGTSVAQRLDVSEVPKGAYQAVLVVDGGEEAVFGTQVALEL